MAVVYPDVNSLWDALTADWGKAGSYGLLIETYLTAVMRGTDGAALITDGWDAALATILDNFTATRIGYLDELHPAAIPNDLWWLINNLTDVLADVTGIAGAAMRGTDGAALAADGWDAGLATILDNFSPANIGYLDRVQYHVVRGTWFSNLDDLLTLTQAASDDNLPDVVLPDIGGAIDRVYLGLTISSLTNLDAGTNGLTAAVDVMIKASGGAWLWPDPAVGARGRRSHEVL